MNIRNYILTLAALMSLGTSALADNVRNNTLAVQGYDVVSYHTAKRPVRGNGHFITEHDGVSYQFSTKENLERFTANPEVYVPAYGGFCAFGVSVGKKFSGDPEVWRIVDNRLYLNLDTRIQADWLKDIPGRISAADDHWQKIESVPASKL